MCIINTSNCSTLVTYKIYVLEVKNGCETLKVCSTTIAVSSLKVSNLYIIPYGLYGSPNEQIWMCEHSRYSNSGHKCGVTMLLQLVTSMLLVDNCHMI